MTEQQPISAQHPDWAREKKRFWDWDPARSLLASIRAYQKHSATGGALSFPLLKFAAARHFFWSTIAGAEIPLTAQLGGGLLVPHPNGIVIHPDTQIGPNCLIFQQVTIGATTKGIPIIGGHVDIGAGAKIIGPVHVGDHVRIGVNAVVVGDIPTGATVHAPVGQISSTATLTTDKISTPRL